MWEKLYLSYREPGSFVNCLAPTWLAGLCATSAMWALCVPIPTVMVWILGMVSISSGTMCVQAFIGCVGPEPEWVAVTNIGTRDDG